MTVTVPAPISTETATRRQAFEHITPNWFAAVMGTGIVATAAATLPVQFRALHVFAVAVWICAAAALVVMSGAFAMHWIAHRDRAVAYARHPVMMQFYGAPPMALLTVGAGAGLLGADLLGATASTALFAILWATGTLAGLLTSVAVPYRMITASDHRDVTALPAWLMPVVPPMVSASTGALLLPHVPDGQWRLALLCACYAMFGLSLIVGMLTMTLIYGRLLHGGLPPIDAAPTLWITLGLIGQSITAANLLGTDASMVFIGSQASIAVGLHVFGIGYGLIMGGFGTLMFALAAALTVHAARRNLGFSLTWWSFTFPIGTCVTGATALGTALDFGAVHALAVVLYAVLLAAWVTVATRTVRGVLRGTLLYRN
ncbi:C4-dicarboxylate ABC transporter [Rhodococcus sp. Leaf278]|uniref:TDT family transporter n=1 Tax=Rhodococcus sp. Leaf278 TaxID=1736319 RepID=UPI00070DE804|nr:TDT family transporter [Rhodococcus sp. Leaf278]KQU54080.1 C4-dicarboxylate ABC transporter [Rhodococcus sp. Leaf278]